MHMYMYTKTQWKSIQVHVHQTHGVHHSRLVTKFSLAMHVHPAMQTCVQMNDVYQQNSCIHVHVCAGTHVWRLFGGPVLLLVLSPMSGCHHPSRLKMLTGIGKTSFQVHESTLSLALASLHRTSTVPDVCCVALAPAPQRPGWCFLLPSAGQEWAVTEHSSC